MRKNLAKHTAKKLPLAKRVLALCFALIFVCSCLLPAFANGTGEGLDTPGTEVVEAADPGTEPESMDLYDEPAAMDDDFAVADEPAAMDDDFAVADEPAAMDDQVEKPVVDDEPAAMDDQVEKPVEGGEPPVADDTPAAEGATKTTTDASGNTVYEYDTSGTTFPEDDAAALPDGDQVLDQMDAAFSIPTNIYHFWLKKMSSYDLADIATDAEAAEMTVEQYLAMYGTDKGCYHIMTAADGANLKDYQFADPTSNDDPEGNSRTFAGWYYTDDLGEEQKFVFDEHLYVSEGTTVEVYAKWTDEEKVEEPTTVDVTGNATVDYGSSVNIAVKVAGMPEDTKSLSVAVMDDDAMESFYEVYSASLNDESEALMPLIGFNITPKDDVGVKVQPTTAVTVTISDLTELGLEDDEKLKVLHQTASGVETLDAEYNNGTLTFKTDSFSDFVLAIPQESAVSTLELTGADTVSVGSTIYLTGTTSSYNCRAYSESWKSSNESTATVGNYGNVTGVAPGTVTITHTYCENWNYHYYSNKCKLKTENTTITVTKFRDGVNNKYAAIYYLKDPESDPLDNDTGLWAPGQNSSRLYAIIHTDTTNGTGWPTWTPGSESGGTNPHKNIITTDDQRVSDYIDGSGTVGITVRTLDNGEKVLVVPKILSDGQKNTVFENIWNSVKDIAAYKVLLGDENKVKELILTPKKISRSNGSGNQQYHVDCKLTVVNEETFTARFFVKEPWNEQLWRQVDAASYTEGDAIAKTTKRDDDKTQFTVGSKKTVRGITYVLTDWYVEGLNGGYDPLGELTQPGDWAWHSDKNNVTGYRTTSTDSIRSDSEVNFYAVWEPETQDITITKHVTGLFGDKDREFNFSVSLNPTATDVTATKNLRDGSTQAVANLSSFTLRHNDSITLNGVPVGTVITIMESDASDYTVTATGATGSEQKGDNASFTYTVVANSASTQSLEDGESDIALMSTTEEVVPNNSITITNTFDAPVDNGVLLDTLPYILILVVVVGGGVLLFLRKRKNDDDE